MLAPIQVKMPKRIQSHLTAPVSLGSQRALTILRTHSHKSGVEVASWHRGIITQYEDIQRT